MIRERAMELVAALRSGDFKQGRENLCRDGRFCCLGVACNIANLEYEESDGLVAYSGFYTAVLPPKAQSIYGFCGDVGERRDGSRLRIGMRSFTSLADANDRGVTFAEIADYIEQNWDAL